jgi:hypothetical protein
MYTGHRSRSSPSPSAPARLPEMRSRRDRGQEPNHLAAASLDCSKGRKRELSKHTVLWIFLDSVSQVAGVGYEVVAHGPAHEGQVVFTISVDGVFWCAWYIAPVNEWCGLWKNNLNSLNRLSISALVLPPCCSELPPRILFNCSIIYSDPRRVITEAMSANVTLSEYVVRCMYAYYCLLVQMLGEK